MYICDCCKKRCNRTINVFITLNLCPTCYDKWKSGELKKEEEKKAPEKPKKPRRYTADRSVIQKLSSILVWVVALFLYMVLDAFGVKNLWLLFVVAVPANAIVLLSLRSAWKLYGWNRFLISVIMWGFLLVIYLLLLLTAKVNVWKILPMGLLGQAAIILWFKMFRSDKEDTHE